MASRFLYTYRLYPAWVRGPRDKGYHHEYRPKSSLSEQFKSLAAAKKAAEKQIREFYHDDPDHLLRAEIWRFDGKRETRSLVATMYTAHSPIFWKRAK